jgi:hypothetical protein
VTGRRPSRGGGEPVLRIEQPPRHGPNLIERRERLLGLTGVDDPSPGNDPEVIMPQSLHPMTVAGS